MIDCALEFGLLQKTGKTAEGLELYKSAEELFAAGDSSLTNDSLLYATPEVLPKVLNIDSTFTVTLMPGLKLKNLLPLTDFLLVKRCGVVTEFEITRQSVSTGFDNDLNPDLIFERIEKYTWIYIKEL